MNFHIRGASIIGNASISQGGIRSLFLLEQCLEPGGCGLMLNMAIGILTLFYAFDTTIKSFLLVFKTSYRLQPRVYAV